VKYPRSAALRALLDGESFDRLARAGDFSDDVCGSGTGTEQRGNGSLAKAAGCAGSADRATGSTRRLAKLWLEQDRLLCVA
jgi:hypothetical protein